MILIRNGRVIGPAEGLDIKADVVLDGGKIACIIPAAGLGKDGNVITGSAAADNAVADHAAAAIATADSAAADSATVDHAASDSRRYTQSIDAEGMIVAPGRVDVHVHVRDPGLT